MVYPCALDSLPPHSQPAPSNLHLRSNTNMLDMKQAPLPQYHIVLPREVIKSSLCARQLQQTNINKSQYHHPLPHTTPAREITPL